MKKHYEALDGLRGVAALCVLAYHVTTSMNVAWVAPHGYLAVDFFFVLSGFVIAQAYEQRLQSGLGFWSFLGIRAKRLWPLIALGTLLGLFVAFAKWKLTGQPALWAIEAALLFGLLLIPTALPFEHSSTFPLNGPAWSLFYEVVANAAYAVSARFLTVLALSIVVAISAVSLGLCAASAGKVDGGGMLVEWPLGLSRVAFSFAAGVLLHRLRPRIKLPLPVLAVLVIAAAAFPMMRGYWMVELAFVVVVFPLVVAAGVHAGGGRWSRLAGRLSYPLYATHYPLVQAFSNQARAHHLHGFGLGLFLLGEAGAALLLAYLADRFVDVPARALLARFSMPAAIAENA